MDKSFSINEMFNSIAYKYDFLNHFLSLGIDKYWRKKAVSHLKNPKIMKVLDVATGTADLAIAAIKQYPLTITGIDIAENMLKMGRQKIEKLGLNHAITLMYGQSEKIPFSDYHFDAVMVSFGVRNFENLELGLSEMLRVLKINGKVIILEFSKPTNRLIKSLYSVYFKYILPTLAYFFSKNYFAYKYLPESVEKFPCGNDFIKIMEKVGYQNCNYYPLTFGIVTLYIGYKV